MAAKIKDLATKLGVGYRLDEAGERLLMGTVCEKRELSPNDYSVIAAVATESPSARDGAVLRIGGVKLAKYRKNPVVLWAHDYASRPVAVSEWEKIEAGKLVGKATFHRKTELSAEVWKLIEADVLRAWSVGFMVGDYGELIAETKEDAAALVDEESICRPRYEIRTWELMEYSSCPVPADAESLTLGIRALHDRGVSLPVLEHKLREAGFEVPRLVVQEVKGETIVEGDGEYVVDPPVDPAAETQVVGNTDEGKDGVEPNDVKPEDGADGAEPAKQWKYYSCEDCGYWEAREAAEGGTCLKCGAPLVEGDVMPPEPEKERVEETEDYIHVPVRNKNLFRDDTIRTWSISAREGIQAVGGKLKTNAGEEEDPMVIQKYLFAKEKGWTVEKAEKWVADHKKSVETWYADFRDRGHAFLEPWDIEFAVSDSGVLWAVPIGRGGDQSACPSESAPSGRGAISYHDYGAANENAEWDAGAEVKAASAEDLKKMCAWFDSEHADLKTAYKFPHHRQGDKKAVWRGVANAVARLGRSNIPAADKSKVRNHLLKHYAHWDKPRPEASVSGVEERKGKEISARNARDLRAWAKNLRDAADGIEELAGRSEEHEEEKGLDPEEMRAGMVQALEECDLLGGLREALRLGR